MSLPNTEQLRFDKFDALTLQNYLKYRAYDRQQILGLIEKYLRAGQAGEDDDIAILSAGPGPGEFDVEVARLAGQLAGPEHRVRYIGVEPNQFHVQTFEAAAEAANLPGVDFVFRQGNIEEYQTDERFDCIHYTQSLYYLSGQEEAGIRRALDMLKPNGFLVIVIDTSNATMFNLIDKRTTLDGVLVLPEGVAFADAEVVRDTLKRMGLEFEELVEEGYVDVTPCFEEDSQEGSLLFNFLSLTNFAGLSEAHQQELRDHLRTLATEQAGKLLAPEPMATFVITRAGQSS